jgi:hypothetical protein
MREKTYIETMKLVASRLGFDGSIYKTRKPSRVSGQPTRLTLAQRRAVDRVSTERVGWRPFRPEAIGYFNG